MADKIGSLWAVVPYKGKDWVGFGLLFKTKRSAAEAYRLFKAWNYGRYIDEDSNIVLSVVEEPGDLHRYSMILYVGDRQADLRVQEAVHESHGASVSADTARLVPWFATFGDYWNRPQLQNAVARVRDGERVLLNAYWLDGDQPRVFAKTHLELGPPRYLKRADLPDSGVESLVSWAGPWAGIDGDERSEIEPAINAINAQADDGQPERAAP